MRARVAKYIQTNKLFCTSDLLLLAVSGGTDSMCMAHILNSLGYNYIVCHCNFDLRDDESDEEENFVINTFNKNQTVLTKKFNTKEYARLKGISIEMAARDLRYEWFNQIAIEYKANYICTAHNSNDNTETVLLNIIRGTGITGMGGINHVRGNIRRPLLSCKREEIIDYNKTNNVEFRTDSSNLSDIYKRNKIRNRIIPYFEELNPSFLNTMEENIDRFQSVNSVYTNYIEVLKQKLITNKNGNHYISIFDLQNLVPDKNILFDVLKEFNLSHDSVSKIYNETNTESGKTFSSKSHILTYTKDFVQIQDLATIPRTEKIPPIIGSRQTCEFYSVNEISFSMINYKEESSIYFDLDKITFPLTFKKWEKGEKIQLQGMKGRRKISDLLSEREFETFPKNEKQVLAQGKDILWVHSKRINANFVPSKNTLQVLKITFLKDF